MDIRLELPQMQEGERVEIFLRKHIMFLVAPLSTVLAIMILPTIAILVLMDLSSVFNQPPIKNLLIIFLSIYLLTMCGYALFIWFRYYYSYLIVTNTRLIEIEQRGIFNRVTSELELLRVEDVKALVRGFLATFLRYGDVLVETAGATTENFLFEKIPNASYVSTKILELSQQALKEHAPEVGGRLASITSQGNRYFPANKMNTSSRNANSPVDGISSVPPVREEGKEKASSADNMKDNASLSSEEAVAKFPAPPPEEANKSELKNLPPSTENQAPVKGKVLYKRNEKNKNHWSGFEEF